MVWAGLGQVGVSSAWLCSECLLFPREIPTKWHFGWLK